MPLPVYPMNSHTPVDVPPLPSTLCTFYPQLCLYQCVYPLPNELPYSCRCTPLFHLHYVPSTPNLPLLQIQCVYTLYPVNSVDVFPSNSVTLFHLPYVPSTAMLQLYPMYPSYSCTSKSCACTLYPNSIPQLRSCLHASLYRVSSLSETPPTPN